MRNNLLDKLSVALKNDISNECEVVYILSKIRKLIDVEDKRDKYKILEFYCDWALHSKMTFGTKKIGGILEDFINHKDGGGFLKFDSFITDYKRLIEEYNLPKIIFYNNENADRLKNSIIFINYLISIYNDVPLEFDFNGNTWIIKIKEDSFRINDMVSSISYSIQAK